MTSNVIEGKSRKQPADDKGLAIGEVDAHVFICPSCARPLSDGTSVCGGCGAKLLLGVQVRKAAMILSLGLVFGVLLGGGVTASAITLSLRASAAEADAQAAAAAAAAAASAVPSTQPSAIASIAPVGPTNIPPAALSAFSGTAVVNGRISTDAATLAELAAAKGTATIDLARALRSLAADAALGLDLADRMAPWIGARDVRSELDAFYRSMARTARDGLRAPLTDAGSYRASAAAMLEIVGGLASVDAVSRELAASAGVDLPVVALPEDTSPS